MCLALVWGGMFVFQGKKVTHGSYGWGGGNHSEVCPDVLEDANFLAGRVSLRRAKQPPAMVLAPYLDDCLHCADPHITHTPAMGSDQMQASLQAQKEKAPSGN